MDTVDFRTALTKNTILRFTSGNGAQISYTINREIGRGGSCIVYDAFYKTNAGDRKSVRIKECYPYKLKITRNASGELIPSAENKEGFKAIQAKMLSDFKIGNSLFYSDGLSDSLANTIDIYRANNTSYIVSVYSPENTLASYKPGSLKECISIIKKAAYTLLHIHNAGYLYLDLKPDNVLIIKGQTERIQLFDFDSLLPVSAASGKTIPEKQNIRLSYSKGFSAVELQMSAIDKLGPHTDVYSVGALLFYMLFNKTPSAPDCAENAEYDFSKMNYTAEYRDKLFFALTEFFHKTLADYYSDRYPDMNKVLCRLEEIEKYADTEIPFIYSTPIMRPRIFAGREKEMRSLDDLIKNRNEKCIFITGMGGIGKSAIVREYLSVHKAEFDSILYLQFATSVMDTINDDIQLRINTVEKNDAETPEEYYLRKLRCISRLTAKTNTILAIDNFPVNPDNDLTPLLSAFPKVIIISRSAAFYPSFACLKIETIFNKAVLKTLFEGYLQRCISADEAEYFENILEKVDNHTLALELIAKQISNSYLSIKEASELVTEYGFSNMAPEKIVYDKDMTVYYDTIGNIITALFIADNLSETKKVILKTVSLFDDCGIDANLLQSMLNLPRKDDMNELRGAGWLQADGSLFSMHPVIKETVCRLEWNELYISAFLKAAEYLYGQIVKVWSRESCPMKLFTVSDADSEKEKPVSGSCTEKRHIIIPSKQEILSEAHKAEEERRKLGKFVRLSESFLKNSEYEKALCDTPVYKELLYAVVINIPRYRENYIKEKSELLLHESGNKDTNALMQIYMRLIDIYTSQKDYDTAYIRLTEAKKAADTSRSNQTYAMYYNMLSWYYDCKLDGAYIAETETEQELFDKDKQASELELYYSEKLTNPNGKRLFVMELLSKATILMRSEEYTKSEVNSLLLKASMITAEIAKPFPMLISYFYMVAAWYFTLVEKDYTKTKDSIKKSCEIATLASETELDEIYQPIIPCANMEFRWGHYEESARMLLDAVRICEKYEDVVPYIRMKSDLLEFALDVYYTAENFEMCRKLIEEIDRQNQLYADLGIHNEIDPDILAGVSGYFS